MTVNGLAFSYLLAVADLLVWPYPLLITGFLIGFVIRTPALRIRRGPAWILLGLILALFNFCQLLWATSNEAIIGGWLWVLVASEICTGLLGGVLWAIIAKARARDAFGNPWAGLLIPVPVAGLFVLFTKRKGPAEPEARIILEAWEMPPLAWLVMGFALISINRGTTELVDRLLLRAETETPADPAFAAAVAGLQLQTVGLASYLDEIVTATETPQLVDADLLLIAIKREDHVVHYTFVLDAPEAEALSDEYRDLVISQGCDAFLPALNAGAEVQYHYRSKDGFEFEVLSLTDKACLV